MGAQDIRVGLEKVLGLGVTPGGKSWATHNAEDMRAQIEEALTGLDPVDLVLVLVLVDGLAKK